MGKQRSGRDRMRGVAAALAGTLVLGVASVAGPVAAGADDDPERRWAHVVVATGLVDNVSICTWAVCGDPASAYRTAFEQRGIMLLDLDPMGLVQQPGPGWWFIDGTFVRDSFDRNVTARAGILSVTLTWSRGGLGTDSLGVTFTVDVQPTGQRFTVSDTSLTIDPLEAGVAHTFTVTATLPDGSTVQGPVVSATPEPDPDPDCTDHSVARECRAATGWAVVHPSTGMVENVIVCTPWQCGADGPWGGRMPADTPWPGHLLIELTGPGGIGWRYVDGTFVDVRPRETLGPAPAPSTDGTTGGNGTGATEEAGDVDAPDGASTPPALPGDGTGSGDDGDDGSDGDDAEAATPTAPPSEAGTEPDDRDGPGSDGSVAGAAQGAADGDDAAVTVVTADEERPPGPLRRAVGAIAAFLRNLLTR